MEATCNAEIPVPKCYRDDVYCGTKRISLNLSKIGLMQEMYKISDAESDAIERNIRLMFFGLQGQAMGAQVEDLREENIKLAHLLDEIKNRLSNVTNENLELVQENLKLVQENVRLRRRNTNPSVATEMHSKLASDFAESIYPVLDEIKDSGLVKLQEIADQLNSMGLKTRTGGDWSASAVFRLEKRQQESLNPA